MTDDQLKALFSRYVAQLRHVGKCEAFLPQYDFEAMREFVKANNCTTTESNAENVLNVHIEGKVIKIGGY